MTQRQSSDDVWGVASRDWAAIQEKTLCPLFAAVLEAAGVGSGSKVLDVACGTGLFCLMATKRGSIVAGLDASPGQLVVAHERLPNADLREGEMEVLPFPAESF